MLCFVINSVLRLQCFDCVIKNLALAFEKNIHEGFLFEKIFTFSKQNQGLFSLVNLDKDQLFEKVLFFAEVLIFF